MSWSTYCVISEISRTSRIYGNSPAQQMVTTATSAISQINNAKLYVPVVTLSFNDNIKILEKIKLGFKRTTYWNKYRSEITAKLKN